VAAPLTCNTIDYFTKNFNGPYLRLVAGKHVPQLVLTTTGLRAKPSQIPARPTTVGSPQHGWTGYYVHGTLGSAIKVRTSR
jgi:hypothetical protein